MEAPSGGWPGHVERAIDFPCDGDTLMVAKPDRLARSTANLLAIVERLESKGVGLVVPSMGGQPLDTRSPTGKLMLTMLAAVAALERELMRAPARRHRRCQS